MADIKSLLEALGKSGVAGERDEIVQAITVGLQNADAAAEAIAMGGVNTLTDDAHKIAAIGVAIALTRWKLNAIIQQLGKIHPAFAELVEGIEKVTEQQFGADFSEHIKNTHKQFKKKGDE